MEAKFPRPEQGEPGKPGTFFSGCNETGTRLPGGSASAASPGGSSALPAAGRSRIRSAQPRKRFLSSCPPPLPPQPPFSAHQSSRSLPPSRTGAGKHRPLSSATAPPHAQVTGGVPRVGTGGVLLGGGSYCAAHGNGTACSVPVPLTLMAPPGSVPMAVPALTPWHCTALSPDGSACSVHTNGSDHNSAALLCSPYHCPSATPCPALRSGRLWVMA